MVPLGADWDTAKVETCWAFATTRNASTPRGGFFTRCTHMARAAKPAAGQRGEKIVSVNSKMRCRKRKAFIHILRRIWLHETSGVFLHTVDVEELPTVDSIAVEHFDVVRAVFATRQTFVGPGRTRFAEPGVTFWHRLQIQA